MRHHQVRRIVENNMTASHGTKQRCTKAQLPQLRRGPHPEEIKAAIRMRGTTLSALAVSWGHTECAIRHALRGPYPKVERLIARFLGLDPAYIWPDRYDSDGSPLGRKGAA